MFSSYVVHEQMVDHRADGGAEAGQVVDDTNPGAVHLHPGDTKRQHHQKKEERNAWGDKREDELDDGRN